MNIFDTIVRPVYSAADDVVGTLSVPSGVPSEITKSGGFISGIIRFLMVLGGLFTLWQLLSGGLAYITSNGEKGKIAEAQQKITTSILGLVVMTASFIIIAIVSQVLFGNYLYILNPKITTIQP